MKQNKDWTDAMRSALRDAELTPRADGWSRLEGELGRIPVSPRPVWRTYWPRIAAAAAVVLMGVIGGEALLHGDLNPDGDKTVVVATADEGAAARIGIPSALDVRPEPAEQELARSASLQPSVVPKSELSAMTEDPAGAQTLRAEDVAGESQSDTSATNDAPASARQSSSHAESGKTQGQHNASSRSSAFGSSQRDYHTDEPFVAYVKPREKISFGAYVAGGITGSTTSTGLVSRVFSDLGATNASGMNNVLQRADYREGSFRHHQPLSFGVTFRKELPHRFSLETGVVYTLLWSDVTTRQGSEEFSQKLHFIGVPLRVNWNFLERQRFLLYIGAGGMVEKCISANFGTESIEEPAVQWSVMAALGAEYRLGKVVGLYFEPDLSYYFTDTNLRTSRTDSPLTFTLRLGLRLSF